MRRTWRRGESGRTDDSADRVLHEYELKTTNHDIQWWSRDYGYLDDSRRGVVPVGSKVAWELIQLLRQTGWMIVRQLRNLSREPLWAAILAIQPLIWLVLLIFLSAILIPTRQMPHWIAQVSRFNPVNWAVQAARNSIVTGGDWGASSVFLLLLLVTATATCAFATWCFRIYQRSI